MQPTIGQNIKVRYMDQLPYTLHVEVTAICAFNEFIGLINHILAVGGAEVTGGEILKLRGQQLTMKNSDIIE
jgi:hypothetical protein